jgi:hypothetical protein
VIKMKQARKIFTKDPTGALMLYHRGMYRRKVSQSDSRTLRLLKMEESKACNCSHAHQLYGVREKEVLLPNWSGDCCNEIRSNFGRAIWNSCR